MATASKIISTLVTESAVINAHVSSVWRLIKLKEFGKFYTGIDKTETFISDDGESEIVRWTFDSGIVLDVKEEEYSSIKHFMSFHIIKCEPWGLPYTSVLSTIRLYPITSRSAEGGTFVQWSGHYSADASADVVRDGHVKRREALADLAKAVERD